MKKKSNQLLPFRGTKVRRRKKRSSLRGNNGSGARWGRRQARSFEDLSCEEDTFSVGKKKEDRRERERTPWRAADADREGTKRYAEERGGGEWATKKKKRNKIERTRKETPHGEEFSVSTAS